MREHSQHAGFQANSELSWKISLAQGEEISDRSHKERSLGGVLVCGPSFQRLLFSCHKGDTDRWAIALSRTPPPFETLQEDSVVLLVEEQPSQKLWRADLPSNILKNVMPVHTDILASIKVLVSLAEVTSLGIQLPLTPWLGVRGAAQLIPRTEIWGFQLTASSLQLTFQFTYLWAAVISNLIARLSPECAVRLSGALFSVVLTFSRELNSTQASCKETELGLSW